MMWNEMNTTWSTLGKQHRRVIDPLTGVGASPGVAVGRVKVLRGPDEFSKLAPGDVLVCSHTDPAWTALFSIAAAVVTDTGDTLSSGALLAQEYGLPAVIAYGDATAILQDGELVAVDGSAGVVWRRLPGPWLPAHDPARLRPAIVP